MIPISKNKCKIGKLQKPTVLTLSLSHLTLFLSMNIFSVVLAMIQIVLLQQLPEMSPSSSQFSTDSSLSSSTRVLQELVEQIAVMRRDLNSLMNREGAPSSPKSRNTSISALEVANAMRSSRYVKVCCWLMIFLITILKHFHFNHIFTTGSCPSNHHIGHERTVDVSQSSEHGQCPARD